MFDLLKYILKIDNRIEKRIRFWGKNWWITICLFPESMGLIGYIAIFQKTQDNELEQKSVIYITKDLTFQTTKDAFQEQGFSGVKK